MKTHHCALVMYFTFPQLSSVEVRSGDSQGPPVLILVIVLIIHSSYNDPIHRIIINLVPLSNVLFFIKILLPYDYWIFIDPATRRLYRLQIGPIIFLWKLVRLVQLAVFPIYYMTSSCCWVHNYLGLCKSKDGDEAVPI